MNILYPKSNVIHLIGIFIVALLPFGAWAQPCESNQPAALTVVGVTQTTGTFSWEAAGAIGGEGFQFEVRTFGAPGSDIEPLNGYVTGGSTFNTSVTVGNLDVDTEYIFYVRYVCSEISASVWNSIPFETLELMPPVATAAAFVENDSFLAL